LTTADPLFQIRANAAQRMFPSESHPHLRGRRPFSRNCFFSCQTIVAKVFPFNRSSVPADGSLFSRALPVQDSPSAFFFTAPFFPLWGRRSLLTKTALFLVERFVPASWATGPRFSFFLHLRAAHFGHLRPFSLCRLLVPFLFFFR